MIWVALWATGGHAPAVLGARYWRCVKCRTNTEWDTKEFLAALALLFSALCLGPIIEHGLMLAGRVF